MKSTGYYICTAFLTALLLAASGLTLIAQDCRIQRSELKPVIEDLNPFFSDHRWDDYRKVEQAMIDRYRSVSITQSGCKRHFTRIALRISQIFTPDVEVCIKEAELLMHMVFFEDPGYMKLREAFTKQFRVGFLKAGFNREFNFPIGTNNFVCRITSDGNGAGRILIEQVVYIFNGNLRKRPDLTPRSEDDGWFGG